MENQLTIKKHVPWLFFTAYFTNQIGSALTMLFLAQFLTEYMGLTPALMATALTAARFCDLVVALFAGGIVQRSNMRYGQFRSWLLIIMPVVQIASFMVFVNPSLSMTGKAVLVGVAYFFTSGPMNIFVVVHNSLMAKISGPNMQNRLAITSKLFQGLQIGTIVASLITLNLVRFFGGETMTAGFPIVSAIFGVVALSGQLLMFFGTKDYDKYDRDLKIKTQSAGEHLKNMFGDTLKNSQLWILLIADILRQSAVFVLSQMIGYFFIFQAGDYLLTSKGLFIQSIAACVGAFFIGPPLAKRLGKKNSVIVSGVICVCSYFALAFLAKDNWQIYIACTSTAAVGLSLLGAVGIQLYLDAGEYQLYKTGKDNRPYVMSLQTVPMKVGMMVSSPIVAKILYLSGYQKNVGAAATMSDPMKMVLLIGLIPGAMYLVYVILMSAFKITESKSKEYAAANHQMLAERAAKAAQQ